MIPSEVDLTNPKPVSPGRLDVIRDTEIPSCLAGLPKILNCFSLMHLGAWLHAVEHRFDDTADVRAWVQRSLYRSADGFGSNWLEFFYELGCLFGAMFALFAGDRLRRRWMVISGAAILIVRVIIHVTSFVGHIPLLQSMFGRVITGIGNGMNMTTIPTYQAECSRTSNRGLLICVEGGIIAIGTAIAYWIDFGASYGPPDLVWRFPIAF